MDEYRQRLYAGKKVELELALGQAVVKVKNAQGKDCNMDGFDVKPTGYIKFAIQRLVSVNVFAGNIMRKSNAVLKFGVNFKKRYFILTGEKLMCFEDNFSIRSNGTKGNLDCGGVQYIEKLKEHNDVIIRVKTDKDIWELKFEEDGLVLRDFMAKLRACCPKAVFVDLSDKVISRTASTASMTSPINSTKKRTSIFGR